MKKTDKISYRQKSKAELEKMLTSARVKLVEDRSRLSLGNLKDTSLLKKHKYEIAFITTLIRQLAETKNEK